MNRRLWLCLVSILFAGFVLSAGTGDRKIRVLIVDDFSNHDWQQTTALIRGILAPTGLFEVAVSTAPRTNNVEDWAAWRPKFSDYDVVIQNCNDISHGPRGDVLVTRLGDDSIHAGMPRQWLSPDMEVYYYARGPATNVQVLAYARDSKPDRGCYGRWNGQSATAKAAFMFPPAAMSGRATCNPRA